MSVDKHSNTPPSFDEEDVQNEINKVSKRTITPPPLPNTHSLDAAQVAGKIFKSPLIGAAYGKAPVAKRPTVNIFRRIIHTVHPIVSYGLATYVAANLGFLAIGKAAAMVVPHMTAQQGLVAGAVAGDLVAPYLAFGAQVLGLAVTYSRFRMDKYNLSAQILGNSLKNKKPGIVRRAITAGAGVATKALSASAKLAWAAGVALAGVSYKGLQMAAGELGDVMVRLEARRQKKNMEKSVGSSEELNKDKPLIIPRRPTPSP